MQSDIDPLSVLLIGINLKVEDFVGGDEFHHVVVQDEDLEGKKSGLIYKQCVVEISFSYLSGSGEWNRL